MEVFLEFAGRHPVLVWGAVFLTGITIANEIRLVARRGFNLDPTGAVALINDGGDSDVVRPRYVVVADGSGVDRFRAGHIVNARNIPQDELGDAADKKLKGLKGNPLIVCCDNGISSGRAVTLLRSLGFDKAVSLQGGLAAWQRENLPLVKGK